MRFFKTIFNLVVLAGLVYGGKCVYDAYLAPKITQINKNAENHNQDVSKVQGFGTHAQR